MAALFGLAVAVELSGAGAYSERELNALYALVVLGFLSALCYGVFAWRGGPERPLALAELVGDCVLITGFVYCSGGARSVFGFLFTIWIVHAALRAGTRGAIGSSSVATLVYGAMACGDGLGLMPPFEAKGPPVPEEAFRSFAVHAVAFGSVALLAHRLARQVSMGQQELRELGEIHRRVFDNVASGLLTIEEGGRITSFNREAERITGYATNEVLGRSIAELVPGLAEVALDDDARARVETRFENRRGERLHLGMSRSPLRDARDRAEGAILIFQDLTHIVAMEEQLRRGERLSAVGQLAAGLAHEIRNPLGSLSGAIELLGADLPAADAASRRLMRIVERETARLNRLVSDFLSYARAEPVRRGAVDLLDVFEEIRLLLQGGPHAQLRLAVDLPPPACVAGDPDRLRQVFWNLSLNAAEASPPAGQIRVSAEPCGSQLEVVIEDSGEGIPKDVLERVLEPFFTTKATGTGLGLAIAHSVIEAHGGGLWIDSEAGTGTSVHVRLPLAAGEEGDPR